MEHLSFKDNASVNALRYYIVIAAMQIMKEYYETGSAPPQSHHEDDNDDMQSVQTQVDDCCYECSRCKEVTFYSDPLPTSYPLPRCLSTKCLLEIVKQRRIANNGGGNDSDNDL